MSDAAAAGLIVRPGQGRSLRNPVGGDIELKGLGERTGGALTVLETVAAPGEGPPLHSHVDADEAIYFLSGVFRIRLDDDVSEAPAGTFVFFPKGVTHTWQNCGADEGRLLAVFAPASTGMERFFERFAATSAGSAADTFAALAPEAGMRVLGPPLARSHPL